MLLNLINDMMDLAKTEQMKFDLNNQLYDLTKIIENSFDSMGYLALEKRIKLNLNINEKLLPFMKNINCDEGRYMQILLNFLSNALKFTPPEGNISVNI